MALLDDMTELKGRPENTGDIVKDFETLVEGERGEVRIGHLYSCGNAWFKFYVSQHGLGLDILSISMGNL